MSRRELYTIPFLVGLVPNPAIAQRAAENIVIDEGDADCRRKQDAAIISGEIVVCGRNSDNSVYRIATAKEAERRYAEETQTEGLILAPDFAPPPCEPNLLTWCPEFGAAPEKIEPVDVEALPEPYVEPEGQ